MNVKTADCGFTGNLDKTQAVWDSGADASLLVGHARRLLAAQQEVAPHISLKRVAHISSLPLLFLSNTHNATELIYLTFLRLISCSGSMATAHWPSLPEWVFLLHKFTEPAAKHETKKGGQRWKNELSSHDTLYLRLFLWFQREIFQFTRIIWQL